MDKIKRLKEFEIEKKDLGKIKGGIWSATAFSDGTSSAWDWVKQQ